MEIDSGPAQYSHDHAQFVVDDLSNQVAQQAKLIAMLRGEKAQLEGFIRVNADRLGLVAREDGSVSPKDDVVVTPNRAARRAATKVKEQS